VSESATDSHRDSDFDSEFDLYLGQDPDLEANSSDDNKVTNSRPRPQPHVAAALPVQDNAQWMNQHLRSSQVLATSLTMVNSNRTR